MSSRNMHIGVVAGVRGFVRAFFRPAVLVAAGLALTACAEGGAGSSNGTAAAVGEFVGVDSSWEGALPVDVRDGGGNTWDGEAGAGTGLLEVVSATARGIPRVHGENVLRMGTNFVGVVLGNMVIEDDAFSHDYDCQFTRLYQYVVDIGQPVSQIHHFEDFDNGTAASTFFYHRLYELWEYPPGGGDYRWTVSPQTYEDQSQAFPQCPGQLAFTPSGVLGMRDPLDAARPVGDNPNGLETGRWYRIETRTCCVPGDSGCWLRVPNDDANLPVFHHVRVYDNLGRLMLDEDDLYTYGLGTFPFAAYNMQTAVYDNGGCMIIEPATDLALGNNGQAGEMSVSDALMYFDAVMTMSSNDRREGVTWIGPCSGCAF